MDWEKAFTEIGAVWKHDGNPKRPYARLTSGKITDEYFNAAKLLEHAKLFAKACEALAQPLAEHVALLKKINTPTYVVGAAMGGIPMAQRFAEALDVMCAYAEKDKERLLFERFTLPNGIFVVHVEDAVTTGETQVRLNEAVSHATGHRMPIGRLFAFWNWTRKEEVHGFKITALVNRTMEYRWTDGRNPFTPDGRESVEPVRPKNHWRELTSADY